MSCISHIHFAMCKMYVSYHLCIAQKSVLKNLLLPMHLIILNCHHEAYSFIQNILPHASTFTKALYDAGLVTMIGIMLFS